MEKQLRDMPERTRPITADELERMPEDDYRYELVQGRLVRMSLPGYEHSRVVSWFGTMLTNHARPRRLGDVLIELGCKLESNPDTVRGPDIASIRRERPTPGMRGFWNGAPDLVIEVLSPGDRPSEVRQKIDEYLTHGVTVVLIVDPDEKTVAIHRPMAPSLTLHENDDLDLDDVVTGFRCGVGAIFE